MAPVCAANGSDVARVTRGREPVVNRRSDGPAPDWWIARSVMARDEQDDAFSVTDGVLKSAVDRPPCRIERHSV